MTRRHAHRPFWRRQLLVLYTMPDDAAENLMAMAIVFVVIVCAAIFAGAVVTIDETALALIALAALGVIGLVVLFDEATR